MAISGLPPPPETDDPRFKDWLFQLWQQAPDITKALLIANNLSDLASASTARTNLGLGSLATVSSLTGDVTSVGAATTVAHISALGTPNSGTLTNCTGLPIAGISGLGTGVATALANAVTGSGGVALTTSPSLTTPALGAATASSVASSGNVSSTTGIGYATGAGGSAIQSTSKSTSVSINHACGHITMNNAALAAGAKVSFTVSSNAVGANDGVIVWMVSSVSANAYRAFVTAQTTGQFNITVENITGGSLSDSPVIGFAVINAVTS